MVEQSRAVIQIAAQAEETAAATQRTIGGLTEQARGAGEVARTMDDARKQALMTSKAVAEQARSVKQLEAAAGRPPSSRRA